MYYYECFEEQFGDNLVRIEWHICDPNGEVIGNATTEENANLIVTLMNGVG